MSGSIVVATLLCVNNNVRWLNSMSSSNSNQNSNNVMDTQNPSYFGYETIGLPEIENAEQELVDDTKDGKLDSKVIEEIEEVINRYE